MQQRSAIPQTPLALVLTSILSLATVSAGAQSTPGIVIERVGEGGAAQAANLKPGDILVSWSRGGSPPAGPSAHGDVASPLDLWVVEWDEAPRGAVALALRREGVTATAVIGPGEWRLDSRPVMTGESLALYEHGASGDLEAWRALALERELPRRTRAWVLARIVGRLDAAASWTEADETFARARAATDVLSDRLVMAFSRGRDLRRLGEFVRAREVLEPALREGTPPSSLVVAAVHHELGEIAAALGNVPLVEQHFGSALAVSEREASGSPLHAVTLTGRCRLLYAGGNLVEAQNACAAALAILRRGSASLALAESLHWLAAVVRWQGRTDEAEPLLAEALALRERLAPGSPDLATTLGAFGNLARDRGDLAAAEAARMRAIGLLEKASAEGIGLPGWMLTSQYGALGEIAAIRGDLDRAQDLFQRSLRRGEGMPAPVVGRAIANLNLSDIARERGDDAAADAFLLAALADLEPGSLHRAGALRVRADLAAKRGDWVNAEALLRQALDIVETQRGGLIESDCVQRLGRVAEARGDMGAAEGLYTRALRIRRRLAPGSEALAESLDALGSIARREGRPAEAEDLLRRAVDALDDQKGRLGGAEDVRSGFAAKYGAFYQDLLEVLFERGDLAAAFHILERARARRLLALTAERDLSVPDIPAELDRQRRATQSAYEGVQAELAGLSEGRDAERLDALHARLRELRDRRAAIGEQIRRVSPRFHALHYPVPLQLKDAQAALDEGTLLLSYAVGSDATYVFAVAPSSAAHPLGFSAHRLPLGRAALLDRVDRLRSLIQKQGSPREVEPLAAELYRVLVEPVWKDVSRSRRVVVCPDGPLWTLPFGALARLGRPLIEWKPIHMAASATVYAQLQAGRETARRPGATRLVAFGDPVYPDHVEADPERPASLEAREQLRRGRSLVALPGTRREVEEIATLFGSEARTFLGADATEENVANARDAQYVHFACHGLLNERFPLDSSLALTVPKALAEGQENGLLQTWEILERVRLQADLVTLSACESGLGADMGGEGRLGLVQAFQVAGARSVVASLWGVPDRSTARFMKRFYQLLQAGQPKDEALRTVQLEFIRGGGLSARPFRWAAFQLFGDWK